MTLLNILQLALAAAGLALLFRALPWPRSLLSRKPWGCSTCLGGHGAWISLLLNGEWYGWRATALIYFALTAVAALVVHQIFPPEIQLPGDESIEEKSST